LGTLGTSQENVLVGGFFVISGYVTGCEEMLVHLQNFRGVPPQFFGG